MIARKLAVDDSAQVFTIEGVVSAMILVVALSYILTSMTFVSPQSEKFTLTKMDIRAQDTLNVFASEDAPSLHSSDLKRWIAGWKGDEPAPGDIIAAGDDNMSYMYQNISLLMPQNSLHDSTNIQYNVYITYNDGTEQVTKKLVYSGEPVDNAATASKQIVLNYDDVLSDYWKGITMPKPIEVRIIMWSL